MEVVGDDGLEPPTYRLSWHACPTSLMAATDSMPEAVYGQVMLQCVQGVPCALSIPTGLTPQVTHRRAAAT